SAFHVPGCGPPARGHRRPPRPGRDPPRPPRLREAVAAPAAHGGGGRRHALPRPHARVLLREAPPAPPVPRLVSGRLPRPPAAALLLPAGLPGHVGPRPRAGPPRRVQGRQRARRVRAPIPRLRRLPSDGVPLPGPPARGGGRLRVPLL